MEQATYSLKTGWTFLSLAIKYFDEFRRDAGLTKNIKHNFNHQMAKLESVDKDLRLTTSPEFSDLIRKEITDNWETLAVSNVLSMMIAMDDTQRKQVEEFTEKLLK
jgi:hypothetical protein